MQTDAADDAEALTRLRLRPEGLTWQEVDGHVVLLDLDTNRYLELNRAGSLLFQQLDSGCTRRELVQTLQQTYGLDERTATSDAEAFLTKMDELRLLAPG